MVDEGRLYGHGVGSRRGVLLGLGWSRLVPLLAGFGLGIALAMGRAPLLVSVLGPLGAAVWGWLPVGGRRLGEWASPAATRLLGRRRHTAPVPALDGGQVRVVARPVGCLRGLRVDDSGLVVCRRRVVGLLATESGAEDAGWATPALSEPADRDLLVAGLGDAMAGLAAAGVVRRLQLCVIQHAPAAGGGMPARLDDLAAGAGRHRLVVAAELPRPDPALVGQVGDALRAARISATAMARSEVEEVLGELGVFEPSALAEWAQLRLGDRRVRVSGIWAWPRWPVQAGWLAPMLSPQVAGTVQVLSLHLWPVSPAVALRRARSARAAARVSMAGRAELGLLAGSAEERDLAGVDEREAELTAGAGLYRMAGVIVVMGADSDGLDQACRSTVSAATSAGLELRVLHGQHLDAWAAALPLCRLRMSGAA